MTIPELLDEVYREAWRETGGNIPQMAERLGVSPSTARAKVNALGLLVDARRNTRRGCSDVEAVALVRERLARGPIPYFGSPAQQALIAAGEARTYDDGPYFMLAAVIK